MAVSNPRAADATLDHPHIVVPTSTGVLPLPSAGIDNSVVVEPVVMGIFCSLDISKF